MAREQAFGIVGWGGRGLLHLDEGVLAAGDDQAVGILGTRGEKCERTEPLLALADNGGIEGGWLLGVLAPESECVVARGRDDNIGAREEDVADLGTRRKWKLAHSDDRMIQRGRLVLTSDSWPGSWAESLNSMVWAVCVFPRDR